MFIVSLFLAFQFSQASVVSLEPSGKEIEKIKISSVANVKIENRSSKMNLIGAGLRKKKVAFFKVDVYVAQLFASPAEKFKKNDPLNSLSDLSSIGIALTFLRDVEAKKVHKAFEEGFEENKIPLSDEDVKLFLDATKSASEAKEGSTLYVIGEKAGAEELISLEDGSGRLNSLKGKEGFIKKIFSLWLGKMSDSGLEDLKKDLLK